ncbi:MAG: hypothetical protein ABIJ85_01095 [bacterium]
MNILTLAIAIALGIIFVPIITKIGYYIFSVVVVTFLLLRDWWEKKKEITLIGWLVLISIPLLFWALSFIV